jgi:hypothetical protein
MGFLKGGLAAFTILICTGCADTVTDVTYLRVDTYISSVDTTSHFDSKILNISKNNLGEERVLARLPTGQRYNESFDLKEDESYCILDRILDNLTGCANQQSYLAENILSSYLVFDVVSTAEGALAGKVTFETVRRPWWHNATWLRAHPFSKRGLWASAGGDLDTSESAIAATEPGGGQLQFDLLTYMKALVGQRTKGHFGFELKTIDSVSTLGSTQLHSSSSDTLAKRPRLVTTYRCVSSNTSGSSGTSRHDSLTAEEEIKTTVFYLEDLPSP